MEKDKSTEKRTTSKETSPYKWDWKVPPMEPADANDILQFVLAVRKNANLWSFFLDNVWKYFPADADVAFFRFLKDYEKETGVYISPEAGSNAKHILRGIASGELPEADHETLLAKIRKFSGSK